MQFEWDDAKRQQVIRERGVDMVYAALIFEGDVLTRQDGRVDYGEKRFHWAWSMTNVSSSSTRNAMVRLD